MSCGTDAKVSVNMSVQHHGKLSKKQESFCIFVISARTL